MVLSSTYTLYHWTWRGAVEELSDMAIQASNKDKNQQHPDRDQVANENKFQQQPDRDRFS